jgi:hypothetical protein
MAVFGFDSAVTITEDNGYTLLAEGPGEAQIVEFKRGWFSGSDKMEEGPQAELKLRVTDQRGQTATVPVNIPLNEKLAWKLAQLFKACGLISEHATGKMVFPWDKLDGASCNVVIEHHSWTGRDGKERKSNSIARFERKPLVSFDTMFPE